MALEHTTERSIVIQAQPELVFSFFTDTARWAKWWGEGSTIDPRPGGELRIRHSNGFVSTGQVKELDPPRRFVFTFSLQTDPPTPPEDSRVTIHLEPHPKGTQLRLTHELANATVSGLMVQGWRFHLSMFANAIANLIHADAERLVGAWFALWTEPDEAARRTVIESIATPSVAFHDRYTALEGAAEIAAHIGAAQRFMRGIRLERRGPIRHCQGTVLAEWTAVDSNGQQSMEGTNVFLFGPDSRIESVTGLVR